MTAFLDSLADLHALDETELRVDSTDSLTVFVRHHSSGHLDYSDRSQIGTRFRTVAMRIDRFHSFRPGTRSDYRE